MACVPLFRVTNQGLATISHTRAVCSSINLPFKWDWGSDQLYL